MLFDHQRRGGRRKTCKHIENKYDDMQKAQLSCFLPLGPGLVPPCGPGGPRGPGGPLLHILWFRKR